MKVEILESLENERFYAEDAETTRSDLAPRDVALSDPFRLILFQIPVQVCIVLCEYSGPEDSHYHV